MIDSISEIFSGRIFVLILVLATVINLDSFNLITSEEQLFENVNAWQAIFTHQFTSLDICWKSLIASENRI